MSTVSLGSMDRVGHVTPNFKVTVPISVRALLTGSGSATAQVLTEAGTVVGSIRPSGDRGIDSLILREPGTYYVRVTEITDATVEARLVDVGIQSSVLTDKKPVGAPSSGSLRYVHIGDSIVAGDSDARNNFWASRDMPFSVAMASKGALFCIKNSGIGGQTSPQIAQRIHRDVLSLSPDVVGVTMGTNDNRTLSSTAYIDDSLKAVHNAMKSAGVFWFLTTIPPDDATNQSKIRLNTINDKIRQFGAENGVPVVDIYSFLSSNGSWRSLWDNGDGIHPNARTCYRMGQFIWSQIAEYVTERFGPYVPQSHDVGNLLFPATGNDGVPVTTNTDGLFINWRKFEQNSFSVNVPNLFATQFGSGSPTVTGVVAPMEGVVGNAWRLTFTPNNTSSYSITTNIANRAVPVSRYQGRRIRVQFLMAASGFDTANTDAVIYSNASAPISRIGLAFSFGTSTNTVIANANFSDPLDAAASLGQASTIPTDFQCVLFGGASGGSSGWGTDFPLTPIMCELNVPAGAVQLNWTIAISSGTGAGVSTVPVSVTFAQFSVRDVGPSAFNQVPTANNQFGYANLTATANITPAEALAIPIWLCDAAGGAYSVGLPAAATVRGRMLTFTKTENSGNAVTIDASGTEQINTANTVVLSSITDVARLYSNGLSWNRL